MESYIEHTEHEAPEELGDIFTLLTKGRHLISKKPRHKEARYGYILPGRPFSVADMPMTPWEFEKLKLKYFDILNELSYGEAMALCRALDYSYSTYLMRRYHHRRPPFEEVILVVHWYDNGKPVTLNKHHRKVASFFD